MKKDKLKIYILEIILLIILMLALFLPNIFTKIILSLILSVYALIVVLSIKKKKITSIHNKEVTILMIFFGVIYILLFYLIGLYFGYYKSPTKLSLYTIKVFIFPLILIIISTEYIRKTLISQKGKLTKILLFISLVLIDLILYSSIYTLKELNDFLAVAGFILFSSVATNLLYNYIVIRFDNKGVIIYRIITTIYIYILPIIPDVYIFVRSFLRMLYPFIIYIILEYTYAKTSFVIAYKDKKKNTIINTTIIIISALIIMLVSCQFKYGILVIGSSSMTGAINKGDAVLYTNYHNEEITKGDIIIFNKNNTKTVHRVVEIKKINQKYRYYTKGDANSKEDDTYITDEDIIGIVNFKIKYIGYPTIWLRDIFNM